MLPRVDLDHLSSADLKALVIRLMERIAGLEHTVAALREEIARLKGLKGPPSIKPSGMEQASEDAPPKEGRRKRRRRGRGAANLSVHEDRVVKVAVPAGSRFKGYEDFLVQDVIVRAHVIRYRRERWLTPDGQTVIAPLPAGVAGHCGADLRRYVLALYHQGQLTVPRLVEHLASLELRVSKRQVVRLLTDQAPFVGEARAVLRAGLRTARWISVDDTGARHKAVNGVCTQIGDDRFTAFATTSSKSRLNFLEVLRAGYPDYAVNAEALAYLRSRALPQHAITRLAEHPCKQFADEGAWCDHLRRLGIDTLRHSHDAVRLASEGGLWGSIKAHGLLPDAGRERDAGGLEQRADHAGGGRAQGHLPAVLGDRHLLEPVEAAQHIAPLGPPARVATALVELLAQHERQERAEHVAADRRVRRVVDRPRAHQRLGRSEQLLHPDEVAVSQHRLERH